MISRLVSFRTVLSRHYDSNRLRASVQLLCTVVLLLILLGCAAPQGFDRIGGYNQGQFSLDRNLGFIKLNTPQPDDHNPLLDDPWATLRCPSGKYIKLCEWHCVDDFNH